MHRRAGSVSLAVLALASLAATPVLAQGGKIKVGDVRPYAAETPHPYPKTWTDRVFSPGAEFIRVPFPAARITQARSGRDGGVERAAGMSGYCSTGIEVARAAGQRYKCAPALPPYLLVSESDPEQQQRIGGGGRIGRRQRHDAREARECATGNARGGRAWFARGGGSLLLPLEPDPIDIHHGA